MLLLAVNKNSQLVITPCASHPVPQACAACASVSCVHLPARCADPNMGNTTSSPPPPSPPSPSGFSFHSSPKSWHAARQDCQSRGGELASIHSEAEHREAFALTGGRDAWIGLNDEEDEGNHVWSDGTPMDYHGWAPGQPNNYGGDEDCGGYWSGRNNGRWDDMFGGASCSSELAYICNTAAPIGAPYDPADYSCQPNPFKCDSSILGDCCTARATSREERRCSPGWIPIYTGVLPLLRRCHSCVHPEKGLCFRRAALSTELLPRPCTVPPRKIMLGLIITGLKIKIVFETLSWRRST